MRAIKEDLLLGRLALQHKILTSAQLEDCFKKQNESPNYIPIGAIMVSSGHLSDSGLLKLIEVQQKHCVKPTNFEKRSSHDRDFGKRLLAEKVITSEQLNRCIQIQNKHQRKGKFIPLPIIMIRLGYISEKQVAHYKQSDNAPPLKEKKNIPYLEIPQNSEKNKIILYCTNCKKNSVVSRAPAKKFPCKSCGEPLILYEEFLFRQEGKPLATSLSPNLHSAEKKNSPSSVSSKNPLPQEHTNLADENTNIQAPVPVQEPLPLPNDDIVLPSPDAIDILNNEDQQPLPWEGKDVVYFGSYKILKELGRGGMGVVYMAVHKETQQEVAIKVLPPNLVRNVEIVERFQREVHSANCLSHPNIVPILESGQDHDTYYYVMKLIDGKSLDFYVEERSLSIKESAKIGMKLAEALEYAHSQGIIHRDIKPENIIIDSEGEPMITDFGLAKPEASWNLTMAGAAVGTPTYMSPEQARGNPRIVDRQTDIYSLGATLYEMITGELPFDGDTYQEVFRKVLSEDPIPPHKFCPHIPRDLEIIILKAMEKSPHKRFRKAGEIARELERFLQGRRIKSRSIGGIAKVFQIFRHNQEIVIIIVLLLLTFILIGSIIWLLWERK